MLKLPECAESHGVASKNESQVCLPEQRGAQWHRTQRIGCKTERDIRSDPNRGGLQPQSREEQLKMKSNTVPIEDANLHYGGK